MRPTFFEKSDYIMQRKCVRASEADASVRPTMRPSLEYLDVRKPVSQIFQDFFQSLQINYDFFQEFW